MIDLTPPFPIEDPSRWPVVMTALDVGYALRLNEDHPAPKDMRTAVMNLKRNCGLKSMSGFKTTRFSRDDVLDFVRRGGGDSGSTGEERP